jgi:hypothetical protein
MNTNIILLTLFIIMMLGCAAKKTIETPDADLDTEVNYKLAVLWAYKPKVNIRDNASGSGITTARLADGDSVIVLKNDNGWYKIKTVDGETGWVRSDLLGPKELSAFSNAVRFINELNEKSHIKVHFDKKLYHKRIYISFPSNMYSSRTEIEKKTRDLVKKFQKDVYRGQVTARVLKPGSDEEYMTLEFKGSVNADPILPVIPFGRIENVDRNHPSEIKLSYSTPKDISDEKLISTARQISSTFPISYQRVEVTFKDAPYSVEEPCRLWFMENANGEEYKLNHCE